MSAMDMFRLDGQTAIVTGASSGLGVAIAEALADAGADVAIGARRADRLVQTRKLVEERGRRCLDVVCDVSDPNSCAAFVERTVAEFGRVDVLVNNAGVASAVPASRESPEDFRAIFDVNVHGAYWMAQACGRVMPPGSAIVNIASALALTTAGLPQAAYTASKAALLGLTRDLAAQWTGRKGIRVNAIAPGFFESELFDLYDESYVEKTMPRVLVGRIGRGPELGAAVVWLASAAAGYVTGQTIVVDGGVTIT